MPSRKYKKIVGNSLSALSRRRETRNAPGSALLVVTEGVNTEPVYFNRLRKKFAAQTVELVTHGEGKGDPRVLADAALTMRKERRRRARNGDLGINELPDFDAIWIVFDTDVLPPDRLHNGIAYARGKGVNVASSEPCFEFWMLLHAAGGYTTAPMPRCADVVPRLLHAFAWAHYSKNAQDAENLVEPLLTKERIQRAVLATQRVRNHHEAANTPFPANPSSDVDALVEAINEAVSPANKFLVE
jgi:hypothetical protein